MISLENKVFDYESDWVEHFNSVLKNENREEIDNRYLIKANIVESNQTFQNFLKRNNFIKYVPSKEEFFHNLILRHNKKDYYFYVNTSDERFWLIHNIVKAKSAQEIMTEFILNSYLQDKIYLPRKTLEEYQQRFNTNSMGFTLNFEQLFTISKSPPVFTKELDVFEDINFTLQLWPKRKKTIDFFIEKFNSIECPINYKSLNFIFEDENNNTVIKEDLSYDGSITIRRGSNLRKHISFIRGIRDDYRKKILMIEDNRLDWEKMKGGIFTINFNKVTINPKNFIYTLNQSNLNGNPNPFKINAFFMYEDTQYVMYDCIDLHTGYQFYLQVFPTKIIINLSKESCGNVILRLFTNLQRYFSIAISLEIDGDEVHI